MALLVNQLVYTSFPQMGFQLLANQSVPLQVQQSFIQLVYQYWDSYNPPEPGHRAAYIAQVGHDQCLFGWLFDEGLDDIGRDRVPYFLCYYLAEQLQADRLEDIFTCLEKGPVAIIDQPNSPNLEMVISEPYTYQPVRPGIPISLELQELCYATLRQRKSLNLFIPAGEVISATIEREPPPPDSKWIKESQLLKPSNLEIEPMNPGKIDSILQELTSKPIGIQGAVLVSSEGQPMTAPVGMNENSTLIMAGTMLYLARSTCEEFNWQKVETISVRGQEGHIILAPCTETVFLLVKAGKVLTGLLEGEINRTIKKLQIQLNLFEDK
jgi:predicted regulator of Ras-like GTPase activity (Roadblock/LC7/MglB family)